MIATEQKNMTMANGTEFSAGNHPVEMLVPRVRSYVGQHSSWTNRPYRVVDRWWAVMRD